MRYETYLKYSGDPSFLAFTKIGELLNCPIYKFKNFKDLDIPIPSEKETYQTQNLDM